jgi:hypothetical protein
MQKRSESPGVRAKNIQGAKKGDEYAYMVDKFWRVDAVNGDELVLRTRRGKTHIVKLDDVRLRKPTVWEQLFMRSKFPEQTPAQHDSPTQSIRAAS